jgi:hypothetical protein
MKPLRLVTAIIVFLSGIVLFGCATVFKGTDQSVSINSSPTKADFVVRDVMGGPDLVTGTTPSTIKLAKKHEYTVTVKLSGYKDATVAITQTLEGWFWGNLICGGVVGMIIDYVSGAMWDLEPDQVSVSLVTASVDSQSNRLYAVFRAYDDQGHLKTMVVPMIRNTETAFQGK